jgi:serine/threonine protein kinase
MSNLIGRFETLAELAESSFSTVYKALDSESQQTVALKVVRLDRVKDRAGLIRQVFAEADQAKPLNSPNIAALYGVGDEGDLLLAAAEYVNGNSIATMLRRGDGFSVWDFQDIARQVCHALDHAQVHRVAHRSLEPAKIMVQWDGLVKVLGFGISAMGTHSTGATGVSDALYYMSPEQVREEGCDLRSAIFSLGAVLYEMATDRRPFTGETADQVRQAILAGSPVPPLELKPKLQRGLSDFIMQALAERPNERFQSGQELVRALEQARAGETPSAFSSASIAGAAAPRQKARAKAASAAAQSGMQDVSRPQLLGSSSPGIRDQVTPKFAIDPLVAESEDAAPTTKTFSDVTELPPLKESSVGLPAPASAEEELERAIPGALSLLRETPEKPKPEGRELAAKAMAELRRTPPRLYLFAMAASAAIIALIVGGIALRNYLEDRAEAGPGVRPLVGAQSDSAPARAAAVLPAPQAQAPTPPQAQAPAPPQAPAEFQDKNQQEVAPPVVRPHAQARKIRSRQSPTGAPAAELAVDSNPAGADILFDGSQLCQSPCRLTGITPGQHTISASKSGFSSVTRNVSLSAGADETVSLELKRLSASLSVASTPAGAVILIDGKDSGKLTPSEFSFDTAGTHMITLRRSQYLEESSSVTVEPGQTSNVNLTLRHLGETEDIRPAGGRLKKVLGREDTSGMGTVSVRTQPKGAQILVNNRALDKTSPFDFNLNPGTYVIDITKAGYRNVHRVIMLQEQEKLVIQETLLPE